MPSVSYGANILQRCNPLLFASAQYSLFFLFARPCLVEGPVGFSLLDRFKFAIVRRGLSSLDVSVTKDVCYAKVIDSTPLNTVIFLLYFLQLLRSKQFVGHWSALLITRWLIPTLTWWNSIRQRIFYSWIFYRRMNGKHCSVRIRCVHCKIALPCTKSRIVELFHLNFVEAWSKCRKIVPHISKAYFFLYHFGADTVNIKCVLYAISMKHVSAACDILQLFVLISAQSVGSGMLCHSFSSRFLFRLVTLTFCK